MKVGITGHRGFIGGFLKNYLEHFTDFIPLEKEPSDDFSDVEVVVHFAEKNRGDDNEVYSANRDSCHNLIESLKGTDIRLIYASSTHQEDDNLYGLYRRENVKDFKDNIRNVNVIQIPNVYGPFCKPNYNSFVATFCDKVIKGEELDITDNKVNLIYVEDLCIAISNIIESEGCGDISILSTTKTVKEIYNKLKYFKHMYLDSLTIPEIHNDFDLNLFNTFRSYIPNEKRLFKVKKFIDERGRLSELLKSKIQGQMFFSTTKPDFIRGRHFHRKRIERFCILEGQALIKMRRVGTDDIIEYKVDGEDYVVFDTPIFYTHSLENIGDSDLIAVFWMNDILDENEIDDTKFLSV